MGEKPGAGGMHAEHRTRMRQRFAESGATSFADHELLEMLLYYAIPRRNTNTQAHALLQTFGSLPRVLEADYEALRAVDGIGSGTALYLRLVFAVLCRCLQRQNEEDTPAPADIGQIGKYLVNTFTGRATECMILLTFDNRGRLSGKYECGNSASNYVSGTIGELVRYAVLRRANTVVCAHNHPDGLPVPSMDDIYTTGQMQQAFRTVDISFAGHYVVAGKHFQKIELI